MTPFVWIGFTIVLLGSPVAHANVAAARSPAGRSDVRQDADAIEKTVIAKLEAKDTDFKTRVELFDLIEQTSTHLTDLEQQARFALYRLRAADMIGNLAVPKHYPDDPLGAWIAAHQDLLEYQEICGQWRAKRATVLAIHERYRTTAAADDIAWFAVDIGICGDCEGDAACYLHWKNELDGEYLRSHPNGRHVASVVADVASGLSGLFRGTSGWEDVDEAQCAELHKFLDPLRSAIDASSAADKATANAALDRYVKPCKVLAPKNAAKRMTNAADVNVRMAPSADVPIVTTLPLGSTVTELGQDIDRDEWHHVKTPDGSDGWMVAKFGTPYDQAHYYDAIETIINDRLARKGDGFPARVELFDVVSRVVGRTDDSERNARFGLDELRTMAGVLATFRFGDKSDRFSAWVAMHKKDVVYDEPGGRWIVSQETIHAFHERYRSTAAADDIAWFGVTTGLAGECEGDVPCYLESINSLEGEYLRGHPTGNHAGAAVDQLAATLNSAMDNLLKFPKVLAEFDPSKRCGELHASIDPLRAAVGAASAANKAVAMAALDRYATLCK